MNTQAKYHGVLGVQENGMLAIDETLCQIYREATSSEQTMYELGHTILLDEAQLAYSKGIRRTKPRDGSQGFIAIKMIQGLFFVPSRIRDTG